MSWWGRLRLDRGHVLGRGRTAFSPADPGGELVQAREPAHVLEHPRAAQEDPVVVLLGFRPRAPGAIRGAVGLVNLPRQHRQLGGLVADLGDVGLEVDRLIEPGPAQHLGAVLRLEALADELGASSDRPRVADVDRLQREVVHVGLHVLAQHQAAQGDDR